jgi:hypothetical protein
MLRNIFRVALCASACSVVMALAGCSGDAKSKLGLRKESPDEFVVVSNPPLKEPPSFGTSNIAPLVNHTVKPAAERHLSADDVRFLNFLTAPKHSAIKTQVDQEKTQETMEVEARPAVTKIIGKIRGDGKDPIIEPNGEKERIESNLKHNKHINEGEIKRKSSPAISRILD